MKHVVMTLITLISLWSTLTHATITCGASSSGRLDYEDLAVPILASDMTISAMRNLPVGSVLFRQVVRVRQTVSSGAGQKVGFKQCTTTAGSETTTFRTRHELESSLPTIGTGAYGPIYATNIQGIGLVLNFYADQSSKNYTSFPAAPEKLMTVTSTSTGLSSATAGVGYEILFVKTGDIPAGTWAIPVSLRIIETAVLSDSNVVGGVTKDYGARVILSGVVNLVAGTCETPDVSVPMGSYKISENPVNTKWVNFSVNLLNCPPMSGRYIKNDSLGGSKATNYWSPDSISSGSPDMANTVSISFNPVSGYDTLSSGGHCARLTPGESTAGGACLEIQDMAGTNVLTNSFSNIETDSGLTLLNSSASYQIPFKARYGLLAGSTTMSAGKADSAVEFTINYQ